MTNEKERLKALVLDILAANPKGVTFDVLEAKVLERFPALATGQLSTATSTMVDTGWAVLAEDGRLQQHPRDKYWSVVDPQGNPSGAFAGRELDDLAKRARAALLEAHRVGAVPLDRAQGWDMLTFQDAVECRSPLDQIAVLVEAIEVLSERVSQIEA